MKKIKFILILALLSVFFLSCGKAGINRKNQDTLKVAFAYKPRSFDPHRNTDSSTLAVTKQIYSNLFSLNENGEIIPELVEKVEILSDNSILLKLREKVYFHNGTELTAEDVKASLMRNLAIPVSKVLVESIKEIEVIDKYNLKIIQKNSPSILLHNLAHSSTAIVKEVEENEDGINLVGTGPYKISDWSIAEKVQLEAFDKFYAGKAKMSNIIFLTIPETSNRVIALETGEIDIAYDIASTDIKGIEEKKGLKVINNLSLGTDFITINTKKIPDKKIRQAIEYAIDKQAIIDTVYEGYSNIPNSILTPAVFGYSKEFIPREYNLEKARELLKESEVERMSLELWIYDEPTRQQMAQIIQANLKEIGIDVSIQVVEVSSFLQFTAAGEHDMLIGLWYISTGDADYGYYPLLHSTSVGGVGNRSFYSNLKVDKYLDYAREVTSLEERKKAYIEAQKIISEDVPLFPISYKNYTIGMQKNIEGFIFNPSGNHILYKTYVIKD